VRNSLWERLGLQEGDVLFKVGRVTLQRRADVSRIRGELRSANRLSINLRRGKRNRTLSLARPALQALREEFTL
jgi:type II secretory pathway component PulC